MVKVIICSLAAVICEMAEDNDEMQQEQPVVKSENSNFISIVLFQSRIRRPTEVLWINYTGKAVHFFTLNYGDTCEIDTFVTHPWIAWDSETHQRYLLNRRPVHYPSPFDPNNPLEIVTLDMPVYSLRERGLQAVRSCFDEDNLDQLELPRTLLQDLKNQPRPEFQCEGDGEQQAN